MSVKQATDKTAKVDLEKLKDSFDSRFDTALINHNLLEIENKFGFPKQIYVNDKGEIWTSRGDNVFKGMQLPEIKKVIRSIAASGSRRQVFEAEELARIFIAACGCAGPCQCPPADAPALNEAEILVIGDDVIPDLLNEPEMAGLNLPQQDQDQVATMVFATIIAEKTEKLKQFSLFAAPRIASFLSKEFLNLQFADIGSGKVKVFFDSKLATDEFTAEKFVEFIKEAAKSVNFIPFYNELVSEFSSKVSSELPDYFNIRNIVVGEVLEQMNVVKQDQNKVADKIVNSYMALKIPVGYSFIHNAKMILQQQFGCEIDDEQLQEVFARFLDAIIFGLIKDTQNVGGSMPTAENFYAIALEVLQNAEDDSDDEMDDQEDLSRYDMPLNDEEDEGDDGLEQAVPGRF